MTYPDSQVAAFIAGRLVPLRLLLHDPAHQPYFRAHRILWTPAVAILDRRGVAHYQSPGFLPPPLFLDMLHIGTARAHLAWAGYDAAAALLTPVTDNAGSALADEALYWLGVARYLNIQQTQFTGYESAFRGEFEAWAKRTVQAGGEEGRGVARRQTPLPWPSQCEGENVGRSFRL